ncbi:MAG TPA: thioredoxin domain-containing protein [candidate division Zixibacteria bacterium]|nr:thioredoxin domain-containing protein [candidate division Zixibacteria bacterium]
MDVDSNTEVARKFGIMSIPSLIFFKNGEELDRVVGAIPKSQLTQRLEKVLA